MTKWLIERTDVVAQYLMNDDGYFEWTTDANKALNYPSKEKAKEAWLAAQELDDSLQRLHFRVEAREHEWP